VDRIAFALMDVVGWLDKGVWSKQRYRIEDAWRLMEGCPKCHHGRQLHMFLIPDPWRDGWRPARYV
jgi:hypothetical protein